MAKIPGVNPFVKSLTLICVYASAYQHDAVGVGAPIISLDMLNLAHAEAIETPFISLDTVLYGYYRGCDVSKDKRRR